MISLVIPGDPKPKGRPRFSRKSGRAFTPAATRAAEESFAGRLLAQVHGRAGGLPLRGPVCVELVFCTPPPASWPAWRRVAALDGVHHPVSKPDLDNLVKLATDAANGVLWVDDSQIVSVDARKRYGLVGQTLIRVHEIEQVTTRDALRAVKAPGGGCYDGDTGDEEEEA